MIERSIRFVLLFNPTQETITEQIQIPLYYTGHTDVALVSEKGGKAKSYTLNRQFEIELDVEIPSNGYSWYVIN